MLRQLQLVGTRLWYNWCWYLGNAFGLSGGFLYYCTKNREPRWPQKGAGYKFGLCGHSFNSILAKVFCTVSKWIFNRLAVVAGGRDLLQLLLRLNWRLNSQSVVYFS